MTVRSDQFMMALLKWKGFPISNNNIRSLVIWKVSEGSKAIWNPMDTEWPMPNATDYNEQGVKNYASITDGIEAFWNTLEQPVYAQSYGPIIQALASSDAPAVTCAHISSSIWGSHPSSTEVSEVLSNFEYYASMPIAGSGSTVEPTIHNTPGPNNTVPPTLNKGKLRNATMPVVAPNGDIVSYAINENNQVIEVTRKAGSEGEPGTNSWSAINVTDEFPTVLSGVTSIA